MGEDWPKHNHAMSASEEWQMDRETEIGLNHYNHRKYIYVMSESFVSCYGSQCQKISIFVYTVLMVYMTILKFWTVLHLVGAMYMYVHSMSVCMSNVSVCVCVCVCMCVCVCFGGGRCNGGWG